MAPPQAAQVPWRALVSRASGWTRDAYVPLLVTLTTEEQRCHACATPAINAGYVRKDRLDRLRVFDELFSVTDERVTMKPAFPSVHERTQAFAQVTDALKREDAFPHWQSEMYAAKTSFSANTLFQYHRGVDAYFGLSQYATHLNGFVRAERGRHVSHVWIAKRSKAKTKWPGLFDTIVGGGLPAHISSHDNMTKESEEEAGLDPAWVSANLVSTGSIGYVVDRPNGLPNNTMFIYDLELPLSMEPVNRDGEVESFELWAVDDLVNALWETPEKFKPDICLVLLDFFVRHGIFTPDNFPEYQELQLALRSTTNPYEN